MAEYVERKAAIKAAERAFNAWNLAMATAEGNREINLIFKRQELCKAVASVFESAPASDVVPVVHGMWVTDDKGFNRCSACGYEWDESEYVTPYCPGCGAKMDGGR